MGLSLSVPTPLDYFKSLVQSDEQFPLLEAAASLAQDEYPGLDVQQVLAETDRLLMRLRQRLPADAPAAHRLRLLNHYFFNELHFAGNVNDYYDPDNSYLHRVLQSRRGIPVSLAVLWLELARGLGLAAHGVGFPGHFLVKIQLSSAQVVIDPFSGASLSREELQARLDAWRTSHDLSLLAGLALGHFLQVMPEREILARMLRNLKEIRRSQQDWRRLVAVQDRLLALLPQAWEEYRDRGLAQAELGCLEPALHDLQLYLAQGAPGDDADAITARVAALQRALG